MLVGGLTRAGVPPKPALQHGEERESHRVISRCVVSERASERASERTVGKEEEEEELNRP